MIRRSFSFLRTPDRRLLVSELDRLGCERSDGAIHFDSQSLGSDRFGKDLVSHSSESNRVSIFSMVSSEFESLNCDHSLNCYPHGPFTIVCYNIQ